MRRTIHILMLSALCIGLALSSCKEEKKVPKKTPVKKEQKKATPKPQPKPKPKPEPVAKPEPKVEEPSAKYFLIAASFQVKKYAELFQSELKQDGYEARIHEAPNGFYRVSFKEFEDRKAAFHELQTERTNPGHEDVWLFIKE